MLTRGSHADAEDLPQAGGAESFDIVPMPRGKKALLEALHRDFDDERDFGVPPGAGDAWSQALPDDPSAPIPKRRTPWTPLEWLLTGAAVLLVAQVPLLWAFSEASEGHGPAVYTCLDLGTPRAEQMTPRERVALEVRCDPNTRTIETFLTAQQTKEQLPKDAQVVELDMPEAVDPKPVETKYLADKTTRTDKETRSEVAARGDKRAPPRGAKVHEPAREAVDDAVSPEPTKATPDEPTAQPDEKPADKVGTPDKARGTEAPPQVADIVQLQKGDKGTVPERSVMQRGDSGGGARILMPATSERNVLANFQALSGDFTSNDHLPDVERGKSTVLNANSYKYADFFHGVKRAVERHWRPGETYLQRDPTGQVYGVKDRYTVLRVELDKSGTIVNLTTVRPSGLDFMDEEAKRAFREAQPFPNPPLGLFDDDGRVRFEFGFYFEITGGKYRFNWRRL